MAKAAKAPAKEQAKRPVGRPSSYDPAYCEQVLEVMGKGLSLTAFAGHISVDRATIDNWRQEYPEFFLACRQGQAKRTQCLETGMLDPAMPGPAVHARRFALSNAAPEEWREKQQLEHSGPNGGPISTKIEFSISLVPVPPRDDIV